MLAAGRYSAGEIEQLVSRRRPRWDLQEALRLHRDGMFVTTIAKTLGVPRQTIVDAFERLGIRPALERVRPEPTSRMTVTEMRNQGATQSEIRAATGLSDNQIKSTLRQAAKRGLVADYGRRPAGATRLAPRQRPTGRADSDH